MPGPEAVEFEARATEFEESFALVLPTNDKFRETLLTRVYYELLRYFANALEIENTVLIAFGFSFRDEHVLDLTRKALTNPTLLLIVVAYDHPSVAAYQELFAPYNNVLIVDPDADGTIDLARLNALLISVVPVENHAA